METMKPLNVPPCCICGEKTQFKMGGGWELSYYSCTHNKIVCRHFYEGMENENSIPIVIGFAFHYGAMSFYSIHKKMGNTWKLIKNYLSTNDLIKERKFNSPKEAFDWFAKNCNLLG